MSLRLAHIGYKGVTLGIVEKKIEGTIQSVTGLYRDDAQENGSYYLGCRAFGFSPFTVLFLLWRSAIDLQAADIREWQNHGIFLEPESRCWELCYVCRSSVDKQAEEIWSC